jgi:hypothetical protein
MLHGQEKRKKKEKISRSPAGVTMPNGTRKIKFLCRKFSYPCSMIQAVGLAAIKRTGDMTKEQTITKNNKQCFSLQATAQSGQERSAPSAASSLQRALAGKNNTNLK